MRLAQRVRAAAAAPWLPVALLVVVSVLSLAVRAAWLSDPCANPCSGPAAHSLIFDEVYYVNAARRIDGLPVPPKDPLCGRSGGTGPQLRAPAARQARDRGCDRPLRRRALRLAHRQPAVRIARDPGMYALARAADATRWCSLLAATLMASDNLLLVAGRIATLDIYVVAFMIWAGRAVSARSPDRPPACCSGWGDGEARRPVSVLVMLLVELARSRRVEGAGGRACSGEFTAVAVAVYFAALAVWDRIAPPYDPQTGRTITGGPLAHTERILSYAAGQTIPTAHRDRLLSVGLAG